jgi:hypothetical protein
MAGCSDSGELSDQIAYSGEIGDQVAASIFPEAFLDGSADGLYQPVGFLI